MRKGGPGRAAGLSHLAADGCCDVVGPSCTFALSGDGEVWSGFSENVEGAFSQNVAVFRAVALSVSGTLLLEGHVERPVGGVLDGPVGAAGAGEGLGRQADG
jgi:hypothetical protein